MEIKKINKNDIEYIQEYSKDHIEDILDFLGIDYTKGHRYIHSPCYIHGGDNPKGFFWNIDFGFWRCMTRHCHASAITGKSSSIFGLVRGIMSTKENKQYSFYESIELVAQILGIKNIPNHQLSDEEIEINKIIRHYKNNHHTNSGTHRLYSTKLLNQLQEDNVYYPKRGFSKYIIQKYNISFCNNKNKPFYDRAFFPLWDESGKSIVGWSARSIYEQCQNCGLYHPYYFDNCPENNKMSQIRFAKWRHSTSLNSNNVLYNYHFAKSYIEQYGSAIICEGPGDVWRYEMAGIKNSVAILGLNFSNYHRKLLQNAGAISLIFTLDNDQAAQDTEKKIRERLEYLFDLHFPKICNSDIGDMDVQELYNKINPILKNISKKDITNEEVYLEQI